jgi:transposase-like protein
MAQHYLLSPDARALRDEDMQFLAMDEGVAYAYVMLMRWGSLTKQICPKCGTFESHLPRAAHKQWRCNACRHDFSLKSGTIFQGSRLPFSIILKAMWIWSKSSKGTSAVEMIKHLGIGYEAAYLLTHKFRSAIHTRSMGFRFEGEVELDVVWVFKHVRKFNDRSPETKQRYQARLERKVAVRLMRQQPGLPYQKARQLANKKVAQRPPRENPKKRPLLSIAERGPDGKIRRSIGILLKAESFEEVAPIVRQFVAPGSHLFTDGAKAYKLLKGSYTVTQVDHARHYSEGQGRHSNGVESGFARWRRMEKGIYHRMNARTVEWFYAECAWREEQRRAGPAQRFTDFMKCVMSAGVCWPLKKYGYEQIERDFKPRHIKLQPAPLPKDASLARLVGTGLLDDNMVLEAEALRDDLVPRPSYAQKVLPPLINTWDRRPKRIAAETTFTPLGRGVLPHLTTSPYKVAFAVA